MNSNFDVIKVITDVSKANAEPGDQALDLSIFTSTFDARGGNQIPYQSNTLDNCHRSQPIPLSTGELYCECKIISDDNAFGFNPIVAFAAAGIR